MHQLRKTCSPVIRSVVSNGKQQQRNDVTAEMMRWKAMKKLRNTLVKLCRQLDNKTPPISTLERWHCRLQLETQRVE